MELIDFELRGEFITLDALLKATGLAGSGGAAKLMVGAGRVQVDGREELRRGAKLRAGQVVAVAGARVRLHASLIAPSAVSDDPGTAA
jgi:ribosome-associated protein